MPSFSDINLNQLDMRAAMSLAPDQYTRQDVLDAELDKIFAREWLCVGRAADIPEQGDYLFFDIPRVAVMAVRQKNGDMRCSVGSVATVARWSPRTAADRPDCSSALIIDGPMISTARCEAHRR